MLKILQARLQQYVNHKLPDVQAGFRKGRGTKLPASAGSWKKAREFQKNIYFCFIDYAKAFDCVDHNKVKMKVKVRSLSRVRLFETLWTVAHQVPLSMITINCGKFFKRWEYQTT